uniref:Uncharacterized protein n=1 Tax=Parastrongyloides trichosuri TaxID=131310 RepID=A0A0N5A1S2_PARTI
MTPKTVLVSIANTRIKRKCSPTDLKEVFCDKEFSKKSQFSYLKNKSRKKKVTTPERELKRSKDALRRQYKKFYDKGLYRPINKVRIMDVKTLQNGESVVQFINFKGKREEKPMSQMIDDKRYSSLLFEYFNRRNGSIISFFEETIHITEEESREYA